MTGKEHQFTRVGGAWHLEVLDPAGRLIALYPVSHPVAVAYMATMTADIR